MVVVGVGVGVAVVVVVNVSFLFYIASLAYTVRYVYAWYAGTDLDRQFEYQALSYLTLIMAIILSKPST